MTTAPKPRLLPDVPLPPYTYIPGHTPHPFSDPRGHSFGLRAERPSPPDERQWHQCRAYLYGIDLFNHGYYWEAHETWEGLWHACGRQGRMGGFLKGLIKLAAAGVKGREGKPLGVRSHADRAVELFRQTALGVTDAYYLGLDLRELIRFAADLSNQAAHTSSDPSARGEIAFDMVLRPRPFA